MCAQDCCSQWCCAPRRPSGPRFFSPLTVKPTARRWSITPWAQDLKHRIAVTRASESTSHRHSTAPLESLRLSSTFTSRRTMIAAPTSIASGWKSRQTAARPRTSKDFSTTPSRTAGSSSFPPDSSHRRTSLISTRSRRVTEIPAHPSLRSRQGQVARTLCRSSRLTPMAMAQRFFKRIWRRL